MPCLLSDAPSECRHWVPRKKAPGLRESRLVPEFFVGLGSELGLALGGTSLGLVTCSAGETACFIGVAGGALVGGMAGAVGGVYLVGNERGGDGKLWATALGGVGGAALGIAGVGVLAEHEVPAGAVIGLLAAPVLGSVIGYELSASSGFTERPSGSRRTLNVAAGPTRAGGLELALHGRF
jgi:hypothetical protein